MKILFYETQFPSESTLYHTFPIAAHFYHRDPPLFKG